MWDEIKQLIGNVAPTIAGALGGPGAALAISSLSNAIFGFPNASEQQISQALAANNPELMLKLKQADLDFISKQKELEIEELKTQLADVANAREREIQTHDKTPRNLAYIITFAFFVFYACMWKFTVQPEMRDIANAFGQTLLNTWVGAMAYFLGTSVGSKSKDAVIANLKNKPR